MSKKSKAKKAAATGESSDAQPVGVSADRIEGASRLHSAAIHILRRVRREDQTLGLSAARLSALSVLVFGGPRTIGQLATDEQVTPPSMTRLVAALEAEGLVVRSYDEKDRRSVRIAATEKGEKALRRGREQRVQTLARALGDLTDDEARTVAEATAIVERALDRV